MKAIAFANENASRQLLGDLTEGIDTILDSVRDPLIFGLLRLWLSLFSKLQSKHRIMPIVKRLSNSILMLWTILSLITKYLIFYTLNHF